MKRKNKIKSTINDLDTTCYSNHSSLKDKWSHNKQSSPMGYQVKSGELQENSTRSPCCIDPLYILQAPGPCYNNVSTCPYVHALFSYSITHPHVFSLRPPCFLHVLWRHTLNLRYTCAHYVYTMRNSCPLTSFLTLTPSLDSSQSF